MFLFELCLLKDENSNNDSFTSTDGTTQSSRVSIYNNSLNKIIYGDSTATFYSFEFNQFKM